MDLEATQVVEMQQEGNGKVATQGEVASVHQLPKEDRTKEDKLRKMREEQSRLKPESTKEQETEFDLKAQIRARDEKINILQSETDALQRDKDNLQQQLKARGIQIAALSIIQQQGV